MSWADATIVGAGIRVGVKADGAVSYMNPDCWYRAYFRKHYNTADSAVKAVQEKLKKALGAEKGFGSNETAVYLPNYKYTLGMEKFDSNTNQIKEYNSFTEAVQAVRSNLAKGVNKISKVYEVVMAVFGVAMNDPKTGEASWVNSVGANNIAALPYEIYITEDEVNAFSARYRIALSWPALGMGTFMSIGSTPESILEIMTGVAGGVYEKPQNGFDG